MTVSASDAPVRRAMWLWDHQDAPPDPRQVATLAANRRVAEVFVSVAWAGPTTATARLCSALRARGIGVSALGGDPPWAIRPQDAEAWARRAVGGGIAFDGIHLDIEPWAFGDWDARADEYLAGVADAVRRVATRTARPVEVDLPPRVAETHGARFDAIARAARRVTLMAYRDSAEEILAMSSIARRRLGAVGVPYRIGVETNDVGDPQTFFEEGRVTLDRETAGVARSLAGDPRFAGIAVHDYAGWAALA